MTVDIDFVGPAFLRIRKHESNVVEAIYHCDGKQQYKTGRRAKWAARICREKYGTKLVPYHCHIDGSHWHIGNLFAPK